MSLRFWISGDRLGTAQCRHRHSVAGRLACHFAIESAVVDIGYVCVTYAWVGVTSQSSQFCSGLTMRTFPLFKTLVLPDR